MDDNIINSIKNQYSSFKEKIKNEIKDNKVSSHINECFLINDSWSKEQMQNLQKNEPKNKSSMKELLLVLAKKKDVPNSVPIIINKQESAINNYKDGINLELVNIKIIQLIKKDILNNNNTVSYFAGYNKLIIEFKEELKEGYCNNYYNSCLLLINPFQLINSNYKSYIITFKNNLLNASKLYTLILSKEINLNYQLIKNINIHNIIDEYCNIFINYNNISSLFDNFNKTQINDYIIKKDVLKFFINLFYFNEYLLNNKVKLFNKYNEIYLINTAWFEKYKEYYNYKEIYNILKEDNTINNKINFEILDEHLDYLIELCLKKINFQYI